MLTMQAPASWKFIELRPASAKREAIVDTEDLERVAKLPWRYNPKNKAAEAKIKGRTILLHRFIIRAPAGVLVDHINRNPLDCRKSNLRYATNGENSRNAIKSNRSKSGYIGVYCRPNNRYQARIRMDGKLRYLGTFDTAQEAAITRDNAAIALHGRYAVTNFPREEGDAN